MPATRDYILRLPRDTTVVAACEDVGCEQQRNGWDTICDLDTGLGRTVAEMIRSGRSGRTYRELSGEGRVVVFRFESGQRCFAEHSTRPARFAVRQGRRLEQHTDLASWGNDLAEHWDRVETLQKKG